MIDDVCGLVVILAVIDRICTIIKFDFARAITVESGEKRGSDNVGKAASFRGDSYTKCWILYVFRTLEIMHPVSGIDVGSSM